MVEHAALSSTCCSPCAMLIGSASRIVAFPVYVDVRRVDA